MFDLKANIVLISVDFNKSQKNILSLSDSSIVFPSISIDTLDKIDDIIHNYTCGLFQDPLMIKPYINNLKFIELHNKHLMTQSNIINMVYGTTVPKMSLVSNNYWFPFDFTDTVIANELTIIGKVISYSI